MIKTLPFDELNVLRDIAAEDVRVTGQLSVKPKQMVDTVLDLLVMVYLLGYDAVNETLGTSASPNIDRQKEVIYKKIAGKDFEQRIEEYSLSGSVEEMMCVAETDLVRVYNQAVLDAANALSENNILSEGEYKGRQVTKTWATMLDERVRDTHAYLEGTSVPLNAEFYTFDGDHAQAPGGFTAAQNNVRCRCQLDISVM
jgi:hypothetical protein